MKSDKPGRSVSGMDVLKDIRGLLSTSQERKPSAGADPKEEADSKAETSRYEEEIKKYKELVQKQQGELERLKKENQELTENLSLLRSGKEDTLSPTGASAKELAREIAQLEQRKSELSLALSEVMELLQIKLKELLRRIALIHQEAGEQSIAIEFRKGADSLETTENLARFLQILLNE